MKKEINKFPYGTTEVLLEDEAKNTIVALGKLLLQLIKTYGPTVVRIGLLVYLMPPSAIAKEGGSVATSPDPDGLTVLPATKELLGIAAVGLACAAAAVNSVTALGIAACALIVLAKSVNKL